MRRRKQVVLPAFCAVLKDAGWLLKTEPQPIMLAMGIDDEYIYVARKDRLLHLHVSAARVDWEAKRYTREPFGDYTTCFRAMGKGVGLASLQQFVEGDSDANAR